MTDYIIFIRGINVSGKNILKMHLLKEVLSNYGFEHVKTYIQSGNLLIPNSDVSSQNIKSKIELVLQEHFQIETICIVKKLNEIKHILQSFPFSTKNTKELYVTFLNQTPSKEKIETIIGKDYKEDNFKILENLIYIQCKNGFGKTKLTNNFFEKKLNVHATTRNWNTLNKIITLMDA